ncbi:hypothetical protein FIBSPDRAFT_946185 [Athelia psychrophila]|uniref:Uncharacterized protein n=1 Tax=Athelia psychrophila TaxID=1759441 RepID=A0A166T0W1_9AGAM|nr:hypothetical protein FIBSPDRAFT_946185 [Fibularhizoctonia sp. CBS 109695]
MSGISAILDVFPSVNHGIHAVPIPTHAAQALVANRGERAWMEHAQDTGHATSSDKAVKLDEVSCPERLVDIERRYVNPKHTFTQATYGLLDESFVLASSPSSHWTCASALPRPRRRTGCSGRT